MCNCGRISPNLAHSIPRRKLVLKREKVILKQCPFWVIAGLLPDYTEGKYPVPIYSFLQARTIYPNGMICKGENCQMWNDTTQDCGLKRSNDLTSRQSKKDEHKQEEKRPITPEEKDLIHLPFPEDSKFSQDPWTCPE